MKPSNSNAFLRDLSGTRGPSAGRLAGLLSPMRAVVTDADFGYVLELEPIRAIDALEPWSHLAGNGDMHTLLCRLPWHETSAEDDAEPLSAIAHRLGVPVAQELSPQQLVMDHEPLRYLFATAELDGVAAVLIEGPLEIGDAEAIRRAMEGGLSPLVAEVRAVASMRIVNDRAVVIETRTREQGAAFVAENFRHYLAALRNRPASDFAPPEVPLIAYLLRRTGRLTVRPIETEIFATSIDVGVSTGSNGELRPADASLVYDIPSDSWHGE